MKIILALSVGSVIGFFIGIHVLSFMKLIRKKQTCIMRRRANCGRRKEDYEFCCAEVCAHPAGTDDRPRNKTEVQP